MAGQPLPIPTSPEKILSIADLEEAASKKLPTTAREFYNSGSTDQVTIRENSKAFSKYRVRPRVLVDVSKVDTSTNIFGRKITFPLCVSPAGLQAMAHATGELATSRACATKGVNMGISSFANYDAGEIRSAGLDVGPIAHAMQLYSMQDRALQERIVRKAESAGCSAILLTADSPVLGVRYNEWRNDFRTPEGLGFPILERTSEMIRSQSHDSGFMSFNSAEHSWAKEIPWLRSITKLEIWIKGVLTREDVQLAIEYGCDGVIVSNHGGRQLDGVPATLDVLPECVEAANGKIRIHVDGGIRTGTDLFKCLALGAECCWVGRPAIWGLAVSSPGAEWHSMATRVSTDFTQYDGQAGVELMLDTFYNEFKRCMQLTGCRTIADITKASLGRVRPDGPLARL